MTHLRDRSFYEAVAPREPPRRILDRDVDCDVCVVGGGYTGLSAALHLAEQGREVVVLEAQRVGAGASGRNGGQIVTGFSVNLTTIARKLGVSKARVLWDMAEGSKSLLIDTIERHGISCEMARGYFFAAVKPRHLKELSQELSAWEAFGYRHARMVIREELPAIVASPAYVGGMLDAGGGHLNPLSYARGLARAAEASGATIFEQTPVLALKRGARPVLDAEGGSVRANHVVVCAPYLEGFLPEARGMVVPVTTHMVATGPLGAARARQLLPGNAAVSDCNAVLDYFRLSPDHRLLFGGGASYWRPETAPSLVLMRRLRRVFPQLTDVACEWAWGGQVAITASRLPFAGRVEENIWFATGFSGQGVALTGLVGKLMAEAISGESRRLEILAGVRHRRFPGGALRTPLLALAMAWYRLRDAL